MTNVRMIAPNIIDAPQGRFLPYSFLIVKTVAAKPPNSADALSRIPPTMWRLRLVSSMLSKENRKASKKSMKSISLLLGFGEYSDAADQADAGHCREHDAGCGLQSGIHVCTSLKIQSLKETDRFAIISLETAAQKERDTIETGLMNAHNAMSPTHSVIDSVTNVMKSKNVLGPVKKTIVNSLAVLGVAGLALLTLYRINCQPTQ